VVLESSRLSDNTMPQSPVICVVTYFGVVECHLRER